MLLDSGVLTVFRKEDISLPGQMPRVGYAFVHTGWYARLSFETSPARPTEGRKELRTDLRVRILQAPVIRQHDVVILRGAASLSERRPEDLVYQIARAYHGQDESSGQLITDLTLEVFEP